MLTVPLLTVALFVPVATPAAPPFPGGLLDSTGRTVYASTASGILAIDLTRGDVLWRTELARVPMFVAGDRLYALAARDNRLVVRAFDLADKGEKVFESDAVDLPRWVVPGPGPGHSFSCRWQRDQNHLDLAWQASAWSDSGPCKEAAGLASVDLDSGKVRPRPGALPQAPVTRPIPPQLEKLAVRWHRSLAGQLVALVVEDLPESGPGHRLQRLVLRAWNERTGKESPPRELLRGRRLVVLAGQDERHLWLRDADPGTAQPGAALPFTGRHWSVFAAVDGQLVARVPFVPGTLAATVIGERAYCLTGGGVRTSQSGTARSGRVLHAIDLTTGKVVWRRPGLTPAP
jgi:hypothetical protein